MFNQTLGPEVVLGVFSLPTHCKVLAPNGQPLLTSELLSSWEVLKDLIEHEECQGIIVDGVYPLK